MAVALAGCGEKQEAITGSAGSAQSLTLMLDWFPNADHVGIYQAQAEGDFTKADLNVHIEVPSDPDPLKLLAAGKVDAAISYEPEVLLARNQGLPLVSVAAIVQEPLTSIVSIGSKHITNAVAAAWQARRRRRDPIPARLSADDPRPGARAGELGQGDQRRRQPGPGDAVGPRRCHARRLLELRGDPARPAPQASERDPHAGRRRPDYDELVVVVRKNTIVNHPDLVRRFVQALARGYESVRSNPQAGVANLIHASPGLDPKLQLASVEATLPAFFPSNPANPWGWQDPNQWNAYGQWMLTNHLISDPNAVLDASTNELLAGQGL